MAVIHFPVVACGGASSYQRASYRLLLSRRAVIVPLPTGLVNWIYVYGFSHLIDGPVFDYASVYVTFHRLTQVDWRPCETDDLWFYYVYFGIRP